MRAGTLFFIVVTLPALAVAQVPAAAGAVATQGTLPAQKPPAPAPPPPPENYSYQPDGRRDPFTNLVGSGTGADSGLGSRRADGAAGIAVAELTVRGVIQSRNTVTAMVQGPDKKTYVVHAGDKLADGVIKAVTLQGLVIVQEVNDPLSLVKQREVTKRLRSLEDAKQ